MSPMHRLRPFRLAAAAAAATGIASLAIATMGITEIADTTNAPGSRTQEASAERAPGAIHGRERAHLMSVMRAIDRERADIVATLETLADDSEEAAALNRRLADLDAAAADASARHRALVDELNASQQDRDRQLVNDAIARLDRTDPVMETIRDLEATVRDLNDRRAVVESEYLSLLDLRQQLVLADAAGPARLDDLSAAVSDARARMRTLEVEAAVQEATVSFLADRIVAITQDIEQRFERDPYLRELASIKAVFDDGLLADPIARMESGLLDILQRQADYELRLGNRLGTDRVLALESRMLDAELRLTAIAVERDRLTASVAAMSESASVSSRLESIERSRLPALEARRADLDAELRRNQSSLNALLNRVQRGGGGRR